MSDFTSAGSRPRGRAAFTIVELLVVIAIIGVLVSILLPAVNGVRDSARRTENANNLKQIGLAVQAYEESKQTYPPLAKFPTGVKRSTQNLPRSTSWAFEILPHLEQQNIYDRFDPKVECSHPNNLIAMATPIPTYANPRRRDAQRDRPFISGPKDYSGSASFGASLDYSANGGTIVDNQGQAIPLPNSPAGLTLESPYQTKFNPRFSGPFHYELAVPPAAVKDGLGNTLCVGDRWIGPPVPTSGMLWNDLAGLAGESLPTTVRFTNPDTISGAGLGFPTGNSDTSILKFGSVKGTDCCFVFLDGHVIWLSYEVDPLVYQSLGSINDGRPVPPLD